MQTALAVLVIFAVLFAALLRANITISEPKWYDNLVQGIFTAVMVLALVWSITYLWILG